ncbi:unnamed protein product [Gadus morhua 'NCC']
MYSNSISSYSCSSLSIDGSSSLSSSCTSCYALSIDGSSSLSSSSSLTPIIDGTSFHTSLSTVLSSSRSPPPLHNTIATPIWRAIWRLSLIGSDCGPTGPIRSRAFHLARSYPPAGLLLLPRPRTVAGQTGCWRTALVRAHQVLQVAAGTIHAAVGRGDGGCRPPWDRVYASVSILARNKPVAVLVCGLLLGPLPAEYRFKTGATMGAMERTNTPKPTQRHTNGGRSMSQTDGSLPSLGSFSSRSLQRESSFIRVKHHSGADTVGTGAGVREGDSGDWWLTRHPGTPAL